MIANRLLLLVALILCCIVTLHASPWPGCKCLRTTSNPINPRVIKKVEVFPISGYCRKTEVIVYRKNGSKICVNPRKEWIINLIKNMPRKNEMVNSTAVSPTASTIDY